MSPCPTFYMDINDIHLDATQANLKDFSDRYKTCLTTKPSDANVIKPKSQKSFICSFEKKKSLYRNVCLIISYIQYVSVCVDEIQCNNKIEFEKYH